MVPYRKYRNLFIFIFCILIYGCHNSKVANSNFKKTQSETSRQVKEKYSNKISSSNLYKFSVYGSGRGNYDAEHKLHDYRTEFNKDSELAWTYISMNLNVDGTQDPRSMELLEVSFKQNSEENKQSISTFISAYIRTYTKSLQLYHF